MADNFSCHTYDPWQQPPLWQASEQARGIEVLRFEQLGIARAEQQIIKDASSVIYAGELVALIGENGAGKSTLLHTLAGQMPATGRLDFLGQPLTQCSVADLAKQRAVLNQHNNLPFAFSVPDLVAMGRYQIIESASQQQAKVAEYIERVGLSHLVTRTVNQLSGGELQRLQFARCLAQLDAFNEQAKIMTKLMLLDEPTAALDLRYQHKLLQTVKAFCQQGNSAVIAIHDLNLAALYADKVLLLKDGLLAYQGTPKQVLTAEILTKTYQTPINVMPYPDVEVPMVYSAIKYENNCC